MKLLFFILTCVFSVLFGCGYEVIYVMPDINEQNEGYDIVNVLDIGCSNDLTNILNDSTNILIDMVEDFVISDDYVSLELEMDDNYFVAKDEDSAFIEDYFDAVYIDDVSQDVLVISDIRNVFDSGNQPKRPRCDNKAKECENYCENERTWVICLYDNVNDCYYFYKVDCPNYEPKYGCHYPKIGCSCLNENETVCKQDDGTYKCEDLINGGWAGFAMPHCGDCNTKCPSDKPKCKEGKCVEL